VSLCLGGKEKIWNRNGDKKMKFGQDGGQISLKFVRIYVKIST
jgi:hypothetical protein